MIVRDATVTDAAACAAIYEPYVLGTAVTFEVEPPDAAAMAARIAGFSRTHAWLVAEDAGRVVGYAYGHPFAERAAYRWSCEVSIYLESGRRRTGAGRLLYGELLEQLERRGFHTAMAGMTLPNPASEGLHRAMGFEPVGTYRRVGWKDGTWYDVAWMQRTLAVLGDHPAEPR
jgi:phosphinothricin acetyltransferase